MEKNQVEKEIIKFCPHCGNRTIVKKICEHEYMEDEEHDICGISELFVCPICNHSIYSEIEYICGGSYDEDEAIISRDEYPNKPVVDANIPTNIRNAYLCAYKTHFLDKDIFFVT